ncbi:MAG: HlyD family efflux transporter periplasmic adaptor subunit [Gammaproteobacteria bacterium]|nr:MAG: HlyD family efflux transporter periplasmic adaptor subunit [Gammaproteobacteria bacterium]
MTKLPALSKNVTFAFNDYDRDGKPQWLIHDPRRNKFFIIGWKEHEILSRWQLADPLAIVAAVNSETSLHIELSDVEDFLHFLTRHYLIQQSGYQIKKQAHEQKLFKNENIIYWLIEHYLFFRIPLWHPDKFLTRTRIIGEVLFNYYTSLVMIALGIIALSQLTARWDSFIHTFPTIFTWQGLLFYLIAFLVCKLFHEFGHAYMCKRYGVKVPSLGVAFLVFWPVLYTDTTLSWSLNNEKRLNIALAGMWMETYITIVAALIWCNVDNSTLKSICYVIITVNWVASLLINVSPFMRFDGYYVLSDLLKMPNLQPRAFALTQWQIRRWLFDWQEPPPEKFSPRMHYFLVIYSLTTWLYRLILYLGIALLVYHFFIKIVGIILFAIEMIYFILGPIYSEISVWFYYKEKIPFNTRIIVTLFFSLLAILVFFLPVSDSVRLPATLSYQHQFLFADHEGTLDVPLPPTGTAVKANQVIARITSPQLDKSILDTELEYQKNLKELRRSDLNFNYTTQKAVLLSNLNKSASEYTRLNIMRKKLLITAPFNGIVIDKDENLQAGTVIKKNEWLGDIVNVQASQIEAFVTQIDNNRVKIGLTGYFYPHDLSEPAIPVKVIAIEPLNVSELTCKNESLSVETPCYHASELGGEIATYTTEKGQFVPAESIYRVLLAPTKNTPINLTYIERGTVILQTQSSSLAHRFFYRAKKIWIEQSSF